MGRSDRIQYAHEVMLHFMMKQCEYKNPIAENDPDAPITRWSASQVGSLLDQYLGENVSFAWFRDLDDSGTEPTARILARWIFQQTDNEEQSRYAQAKLQVWLEREGFFELFSTQFETLLREITQDELLWEWIERFWPDIDDVTTASSLLQHLINENRRNDPIEWRRNLESSIADCLECDPNDLVIENYNDVWSAIPWGRAQLERLVEITSVKEVYEWAGCIEELIGILCGGSVPEMLENYDRLVEAMGMEELEKHFEYGPSLDELADTEWVDEFIEDWNTVEG